jgi:uncharacterized protein
MLHRRFLVFAGAVLLIVLPAAAAAGASGAEKPDAVPNPLSTGGRYVGDGAGILGPEYIALIDNICKSLKASTTAEMAVITVRDLGGTTIEDFAVQLFKRLGIGLKGKDNGILILCALAERDVRVEVGYGLEPVITDAKSARIMNESALPYLRRNEFGRGLFALAKGIAEEIAKSENVSLAAADPSSWPAQVALPKSEPADSVRPRTAREGNNTGAIIYAGVFLLWGLLSMIAVTVKYKKQRALAARKKIVASGLTGSYALLWILAFCGFIFLLAGGALFWPVLLAGLAPVAATYGRVKLAGGLRRGLKDYHLTCTKCGHPMNLLPEDEDDAHLTVEEAAEEKAGGMDYEIWNCPSCGASERFSVKLDKASVCPQCKRRTLTETRTTLVSATTSHGGRVRIDQKCLNPKCNYTHTEEHATPQISSSSSSSSSSGHSSSGSSSSSFGGGRSGGGGSTGHF